MLSTINIVLLTYVIVRHWIYLWDFILQKSNASSDEEGREKVTEITIFSLKTHDGF